MRKSLVITGFVALAVAVTSPIVLACMAVNSPGLRIVREKTSAKERVRAVAHFSEYDCFAMTAKTFCAIGLRLEPSALTRKADIKVSSMKFVVQSTGNALTGFEPKANENTRASYASEKAGQWYGFSALFGKHTDLRGGVEMRIEFSAAPGTTDAELKKIFSSGHVGASGAEENGKVTHTHHHEIVEIGRVTIVGDHDHAADLGHTFPVGGR